MVDDLKPRENIADYIIQTAEGDWVLLKEPVDWKEGETMRKSDKPTKGIDIKALCALICEEKGVDQITFDQMYQICEVTLQMEESGKEVFPK